MVFMLWMTDQHSLCTQRKYSICGFGVAAIRQNRLLALERQGYKKHQVRNIANCYNTRCIFRVHMLCMTFLWVVQTIYDAKNHARGHSLAKYSRTSSTCYWIQLVNLFEKTIVPCTYNVHCKRYSHYPMIPINLCG